MSPSAKYCVKMVPQFCLEKEEEGYEDKLVLFYLNTILKLAFPTPPIC